jgi:sugar phosphate isomerase/epimerase
MTHDGLDSRSSSARRRAVELHRRHLSAAAELGATLYVVHPDLRRRRRPWDPRVAAALERSFEELRTLQDEFGVLVVVENMPFYGRSHFTAPGELDLQGLGLALDVGHAAIAGKTRAWLSDPQATVRTIHLHDNMGHRAGDLHDALGTGVVEAGAAFEAARRSGLTITLEHTAEPDVIASLRYLRDRGLLDDGGEEAAAGAFARDAAIAGGPLSEPSSDGDGAQQGAPDVAPSPPRS